MFPKLTRLAFGALLATVMMQSNDARAFGIPITFSSDSGTFGDCTVFAQISSSSSSLVGRVDAFASGVGTFGAAGGRRFNSLGAVNASTGPQTGTPDWSVSSIETNCNLTNVVINTSEFNFIASETWGDATGASVDISFDAGGGTGTLTASISEAGGAVVTVSLPNVGPTADAGADQNVASGASVTLDASASSDPDSDPLTFAWTQTSGTTVTLSDATVAQPTFTAPTITADATAEVLEFEVAVNDGTVGATDQVQITIGPQDISDLFEDVAPVVQDMVQNQAVTITRQQMHANRSMMNGARSRMRVGQDNSVASLRNQAMNLDARMGKDGLVALGDFAFIGGDALKGLRFVATGEFSYSANDDGDESASGNAYLALEREVSSEVMLGAFVGAGYANSEIGGTMPGDADGLSAYGGLYAVVQPFEHLSFDAYAMYGIGFNSFDVSNSTLTLQSDYQNRTIQFGGAVEGIVPQEFVPWEDIQLRPSLTADYGRTETGTIDVTGTIGNLVDNTLQLSVADAVLASTRLGTEFRMRLGDSEDFESGSYVSLIPSFVCEYEHITDWTTDCGGGLGSEFSMPILGDTGRMTLRVNVDRVGETTTGSGIISGLFLF